MWFIKLCIPILVVFLSSLVFGRVEPGSIEHLTSLLRRTKARANLVQNSYRTQLLNHDAAISVPQIQEDLNTLFITMDFLIGNLEDKAKEEDKTLDPQLLEIPELHPDLATRLPFYKEKRVQALNEQMEKGQKLTIDFSTFKLAPPGSENNSNYPNGPLAIDYRKKCTTGGFMTKAQLPNLENFKITPSLFSRFNQWNDYICKTPKEIFLYVNGRRTKISCNPGGIKNQNINNSLDAKNICDPLLYGFFPQTLKNGSSLALCSNPNELNIGRDFTYSDNIWTRNKEDRNRFDSPCDILSRMQLRPWLENSNPLPGEEVSLVLAAKLAIENPALFEKKEARINTNCEVESRRFLERDHCVNLKHRITEIKRIINRLQSLDSSLDLDQNGR